MADPGVRRPAALRHEFIWPSRNKGCDVASVEKSGPPDQRSTGLGVFSSLDLHSKKEVADVKKRNSIHQAGDSGNQGLGHFTDYFT